MSLYAWLKAIAQIPLHKAGLAQAKRAFVQSTRPAISARRSRRLLRREQLFSLVRESMIRGGVISTSYEFKVLTLDPMGDSFLVLVDLALTAEFVSDEYLLEIERWIQTSAQSRHGMVVRSVYWRRRTAAEQRGTVLKSSIPVQMRYDTLPPNLDDVPSRMGPALHTTSASAQAAARRKRAESAHRDGDSRYPSPEAPSDFSPLSETQFGKT